MTTDARRGREPLTALLDRATGPAHRSAERSPFLAALLDGRLGRDAYVDLAAQHRAIYGALEAAVAATGDDDAVAPFFAPELARVPALEADLEHLAGPRWRQCTVVLPATVRYGSHLRLLGATWPGGVLAHHYVRYLGDLSGGQVIGRVLRRVHGLSSDGTSFYRFDEVPSARAFKARYRARLDALPWCREERERFVDEAVDAFRATTDVLEDLMTAR
ncbi:MAG TPA: biliverdin-producing heme oxygenase [Ilumatobacteraceae bacterium]|nr:biliverdin-producing heme oxygenase [Ilumatobacteraceae bacterium]